MIRCAAVFFSDEILEVGSEKVLRMFFSIQSMCLVSFLHLYLMHLVGKCSLHSFFETVKNIVFCMLVFWKRHTETKAVDKRKQILWVNGNTIVILLDVAPKKVV